MEAPRPAPVAAPAVAPGAVVAAAAVVAGAVLLSVAAGCVAGVVVADFPNKPPVGATGCAADVVAGAAAVPGVVAGVEAAAPSAGKGLPAGAAAGVADGAVVEIVPPRVGNMDFCGVAVDVGAPAVALVMVVAGVVEGGAPREGNTGFVAEAPPGAAIGKKDDVCEVCAPLVAGVAAPPKRGLRALLSAAVVEVAESAGFAPLNKPPLGAADGVAPNIGLGAVDPAPAPKRPPVAGCEVVGVVEDVAAVDGGLLEAGAVLNPAKKEGGLFPGGGPAGVVEVFPNKDPPAGPGVAAVLPNILPPD